jgi:hypothetical protein
MPDLSAELEESYRQEKDARNKVRLLAMRMGASGAHASQDIADICGVSQATFFEWAKSFREGGFDALLEREKPGPKGMKLRGEPEAVVKELRAHHVVIAEAGFLLSESDPRLPEGVRRDRVDAGRVGCLTQSVLCVK